MAWSTADLLALGDAIDADALALGFGPVNDGANDVNNADVMNAIRAEVQIDRVDIPANEIARSLNRIEYGDVAPADKSWIEVQLDTGLIDGRPGSEQRVGFLGIYGSGTTTRANLASLLTRDGTYLELLFQQGTISEINTFTASTPGQIRTARGV